MARKTSVINRVIAEEFKLYLSINPRATRKKKISAFNRIADKHLTRNGNSDRRQSSTHR